MLNPPKYAPHEGAHHWVIGVPLHEWEGPELVEYTSQVCKKCGEFKLNSVVLPREVLSDR